MNAPATRRVRITVEADARPLTHQPHLLRVASGGGVLVIDTTRPDVTVEDVEPPRTWTDGDVLQNIVTNKVQVRGPETGWSEVGDRAATASVLRGTHRVLRYQAGE